jgi:DNA processing protein
MTPLDADFPARLRDLDPPPLMISGRGSADALRGSRAVAVVGTRRPTISGRALTTRVAIRLVECRATVISGLAVGIDGAAHAATVQNGGCTVAVIGAGHDSPGPRAHARLRAEIVESGGALISEYHPATGARKGTYPRRNRIIAALGDATIVVEAPVRSGARITAGLALELGRPVFIAPGRIGDWATAGSLALLRETPARPLVGLDEMVEDLGYLDPPADATTTAASGADLGMAHRSTETLLQMLGPTEQTVARSLLESPAGLDALVARTGLPPAVVSSAVTLLLMRGWAQSVGPAYMVAGALAR